MKNNFAFFGSSRFSVIVLDELKKLGFIPRLIVTTPEKPKGRHLQVSATPVQAWAEQNKIDFIAPKTLKDGKIIDDLNEKGTFDYFVVASYGKIIPKSVFDLPKHKTLNIHPSLLPKLRGATPLQTAILTEEKTGVTIMLIDEEVDHGQIISQKEVSVSNWPAYFAELEQILAKEGAKLLAETIPGWLSGSISAKDQNHSRATFTKKISKEYLFINLEDDPNLNLRKIRALPGVYYFVKHKDKDLRVIVLSAHIENGKLVIEKVKPEGKKEMKYEDFVRGLR